MLLQRRINSGLIVRAYVLFNEKDVNSITEILSADNDFRADYAIQIGGNVVEAEINKIIDYSPANQEETQIEFIVLKDEL